MLIQDRDYQIEAVSSIYRFFEEFDGNPCLAMPTGTGKSVVIARFLQSVFHYPNQRVIIATHVKELIQQNYDKLMNIWPQAPAGIYSDGLGRRDRFNPITFAGIKSIFKRASEFGSVDLLIIDEAHLVSPIETTSYQKFIKDLRAINPKLKVIGLTATPWRLGHGRITGEDSIFSHLCFDITGMEAFNRLINEGYLSTLVPRPTRTELDIEDVHMQGGEFKQNELQLAVDKEAITYAALQEAIEMGKDRHSWLIFAAGVEHAIHIAEMLTHMGVECKAVHSKMGDTERDSIIDDWKAGRLRAVVNNNVLTTGIDHPALDFIVMLRPTASTVIWVQSLGRGTRPFYAPGYDLTTIDGRLAAIAAGPKHNCLVADFAGNTKRLGQINDPVIPRRKGDKGGGEAPVKLCLSCNTYNHATARHCFFCGAEFIFTVKIKQNASAAELIKQDIPIVEVFSVDQITYARHEKKGGGNASMRVTYYCNLRSFNEYVPIEGVGSVAGIAKRWWQNRNKVWSTGVPMPSSVDEALSLITQLPPATHIRVWSNKQYPEILAHCFDGTSFGTQPMTASPPVKVMEADQSFDRFKFADKARTEQTAARMRNMESRQKYGDMDDDIPF